MDGIFYIQKLNPHFHTIFRLPDSLSRSASWTWILMRKWFWKTCPYRTSCHRDLWLSIHTEEDFPGEMIKAIPCYTNKPWMGAIPEMRFLSEMLCINSNLLSGKISDRIPQKY